MTTRLWLSHILIATGHLGPATALFLSVSLSLSQIYLSNNPLIYNVMYTCRYIFMIAEGVLFQGYMYMYVAETMHSVLISEGGVLISYLEATIALAVLYMYSDLSTCGNSMICCCFGHGSASH